MVNKMLIVMIVLGIALASPFLIFYGMDYTHEKENEQKFWSEHQYVEISPSAAIAAIRAGVHFDWEYCYGHIWYFNKPENSSPYTYRYNKRVYIKWNKRDRKLFEHMYKKYQNEEENKKIFKNNSEDGYNYLIQAVEKHRNDCAKKAQQAMDDATEVYTSSCRNISACKKFYNS